MQPCLDLPPEGGPLLSLAQIIGSRIDAAVVTSELARASNNVTNGVVVTTEGVNSGQLVPSNSKSRCPHRLGQAFNLNAGIKHV